MIMIIIPIYQESRILSCFSVPQQEFHKYCVNEVHKILVSSPLYSQFFGQISLGLSVCYSLFPSISFRFVVLLSLAFHSANSFVCSSHLPLWASFSTTSFPWASSAWCSLLLFPCPLFFVFFSWNSNWLHTQSQYLCIRMRLACIATTQPSWHASLAFPV